MLLNKGWGKLRIRNQKIIRAERCPIDEYTTEEKPISTRKRLQISAPGLEPPTPEQNPQPSSFSNWPILKRHSLFFFFQTNKLFSLWSTICSFGRFPSSDGDANVQFPDSFVCGRPHFLSLVQVSYVRLQKRVNGSEIGGHDRMEHSHTWNTEHNTHLEHRVVLTSWNTG